MRVNAAAVARGAARACVAAALVVGCTIPAIDFSTKKCLSDAECGAGLRCDGDGRCVPIDVVDGGPDAPIDADAAPPFDPCSVLPRFDGTQIVDGADDDLGALPLRSFATRDLVALPAVIGDKLDVDARVGWSPDALHGFFHVRYESGSVVVPTGSDPLYFGDALELFVKADAALTGRYDGTHDVGARQLILVPPLGAQPARGEAFLDSGATDLGPVDASWFAARSTSDGYAIEVKIPWSGLGGATPTAGASIGFDFGVDYHTRSGPPNVQYQLLLALQSVPDLSAKCGGDAPIPSCDDRTWCRPVVR